MNNLVAREKNAGVHLATEDIPVKNALLDITEILMTDLKDHSENVLNARVMIMNNLVARNGMVESNVFVRRDGLANIATHERGQMNLVPTLRFLLSSPCLSQEYKLR